MAGLCRAARKNAVHIGGFSCCTLNRVPKLEEAQFQIKFGLLLRGFFCTQHIAKKLYILNCKLYCL